MNAPAATSCEPLHAKPMNVRLGTVADSRVTVGIDAPAGNLVALVPVQAAGERLRLYRHGGPAQPEDPQPDDLDRFIQLEPSHQRKLDIGIERWRGALGVLFLLLDCDARPMQAAERTKQRIASRIAETLKHGDPALLQLALIPSEAIPHARLPVASSSASSTEQAPAAGGAAAAQPPQSLRFVLGSCCYPAGLLDATPTVAGVAPGPADASFHRLAQRLLPAAPGPRPSFLVLAGDQVYVDETAGLFDPASPLDRYNRPYRRFFESRSVGNVLRQLPSCMMLDDHEIADNFENDPKDWPGRQQFLLGRAAYIEEQRTVGPLPAPTGDRLYTAVTLGGFDFFFADTRTERDVRRADNVATASLLEGRQKVALEHWLRQPNPLGRPRFIVSPSALLPRRLSTLDDPPYSALRSDAWDGYPASMDWLLQLVRTHRIANLVVLSGDEHRCSVTSAELVGEATPLRLHSIVSSGLYAPYPFANSRPPDFADHERFHCGGGLWEVKADFLPPGEGYCQIAVLKSAQGWDLQLEFDLDPPEASRRTTIHLR